MFSIECIYCSIFRYEWGREREREKGEKEKEREREREREGGRKGERGLLTIETVQVVEAQCQPSSIVGVDVMLGQHLIKIGGSHQEQRIQRQTVTEQGLKEIVKNTVTAYNNIISNASGLIFVWLSILWLSHKATLSFSQIQCKHTPYPFLSQS